MKKSSYNINTKISYTAFMVTSIDGRIAQTSHSGIDWNSKEDSNFYHKSLKQMDVVIVGHNTYKMARSRDKWNSIVVLSSKVGTLKMIDNKTTLLNPEKYNLKNFLQDQKYKKVAIVGGSQVYNFCLKNKMLDELFVTIEPYVFSTGVSMFAGNVFKKHKFSLKLIKKLNKDTVLLKYRLAV